mmetsp:Transcript_27922/g.109525  ORF Transcript_27922/g.109525 Transcript_27922/m.109525 type:complete len:104 (+) Transcript_27922:99-410(+)
MAAFVGSGVVTVRKRGAVERRVRRRTTVSVLAEGEDVKKLVAPSVDLKNGFQVPEQRTDPQLGFRFGSRKLRVFGGSNIGVLHREVASYLGKEDSEDPIVLKQ